MTTHSLDECQQIRRQFLARAGDAGYADEVDETGGVPGHGLNTFFCAGRREHVDCGQAGRPAGGFQQFRLPRRQVGDDQAVDAGLSRGGHKAFFAVGQNRIVVAHGAEGFFHAARSQLSHHLQTVGHGRAADEGRVGGCLDRRPIGQGIAVGNADFKEIRAGFRQGDDHLQRRLPIGIAHRMIGHKGRRACPLQISEYLLNTFDSAHLSPRAHEQFSVVSG